MQYFARLLEIQLKLAFLIWVIVHTPFKNYCWSNYKFNKSKYYML